jgi:phytoene synthase
LPLRWLHEAGIDPDHFLAEPRHSEALAVVIRRLLDVGNEHYRRAWPGITRLPVLCRVGISTACLLYAEIGYEVARRGHDAVSARAVVSAWRKAWVLASGLPRLATPARPIHGTVPESACLLDAIALPRSAARTHWWHLPQRLGWMIELLARMEQRERQIARHRRAMLG